jgi:IS5 family transposase
VIPLIAYHAIKEPEDNLGIDIKHRGKFRSMTDQEKKMLKRRQAIEPIIGHLKADHRMNRCHLKGSMGDRLNAVLCAAGFNIRWLLRMIIKKGWAFFAAVAGNGFDRLAAQITPDFQR